MLWFNLLRIAISPYEMYTPGHLLLRLCRNFPFSIFNYTCLLTPV